MSEDTYKTIAVPSEGIYTEKRSKFIAIALPVRTVEEVKAHLETYQKKYYSSFLSSHTARIFLSSNIFMASFLVIASCVLILAQMYNFCMI
jgi:hypothetical protein